MYDSCSLGFRTCICLHLIRSLCITAYMFLKRAAFASGIPNKMMGQLRFGMGDVNEYMNEYIAPCNCWKGGLS